jgi:WD40 repeat protein
MPEVQEVFRMATQKIRPEPGALERQFQGQRRRSARRKGGAVALAAALVITAAVVVIEAARDAGAGGSVPADEGTATESLRVPGYGFGISVDGTRLFTRVEASGAIYDAEIGTLLQTVSGRGDGVVAFSPDGQRFATARGCGKCDQESPVDALRTFMYDTTTGEELWRVRRACCFAAFSEDGSLLAIPQNIPHTSVIDVETGERVRQVDSWGAVAFSPDGEQLLITSDPGAAPKGVVGYVYDVFAEGADPVLALHGRGEGNIPGVYADWNPWSVDGSMIAIPTSTGKVFVWDAQTGEERFVLRPPAGDDFTFTGFNVDGSLLAVASTDGTATVFDLSGDVVETVATIHAYNKTVDHVVFGPNGRLMTAAWNRPTKVWDIS